MAQSLDIDLARKVQALPDLSAEVTLHNMPSILLSSPDDRRIDTVADSRDSAFRVASEGTSARKIIVVDPKRKTGLLWWKKSQRIAIEADRLAQIAAGTAQFSEDERSFLRPLQ